MSNSFLPSRWRGSRPSSSLVEALVGPRARRVARSLDREEEGDEQAVCSAVVWALDVFMLVDDRRSFVSISVGELYRRYGELSAIVC